MFEHGYTTSVDDVSKFHIIFYTINIPYHINDYKFLFQMFKIGLWMCGVQVWFMVWYMDSLSLN